jgi:hypothetical protein
VTVVRSRVIGLSSRTSSTSTAPVISSPGRTGARKFQLTLRNTVPGPGSRSATTALRIALVSPPCTMISPNREARAARSS